MIRGIASRLWLIAAAAMPLLSSSAQAGDTASQEYLAVSGGVFDIGKGDTAAEFRGEYWSDFELVRFGSVTALRPFGGLMATSDSATYAYAGVLMDFDVGPAVVTLSFAPGAFHHGGGKDLGHGLEFRSQAEIAYRFDGGDRLGLALSHMSNASIGRHNPGTESLVLTYAYPLSRLLSD